MMKGIGPEPRALVPERRDVRRGDALVTFERDGGRVTRLHLDTGGGHVVLKKKAGGSDCDVTATAKGCHVVQAAPVVSPDREQTIDKLHRLTGVEAAQSGRRTRCSSRKRSCPPHPRGLDFGAVVGSRTEAGRDDFRSATGRAASRCPGRPSSRSAGRRGSHAIYLVIGVVERDGGTLYCTVLFFAPDGTYLGKHRKIMPTASERLVWGFGDGSTLPVFDTPLGRARRGDLLGELPAADARDDVREGHRDSTARRRRTRATRGSRVDAAHRGRGAMLRAVVQPVQPPARLSRGLSRRFGDDPDTVIIARRQLHRRSRSARFSPGRTRRAKRFWSPRSIARRSSAASSTSTSSATTRRPDIFQLHVDERPKRPVTTERAESVQTDEMSAPRRPCSTVGLTAGSGTGC